MNRYLLPLLLAVLAPSAFGASDADIRAHIAKRFPGVTADDVRPSPIEGLYEVMVGPLVIYSSADGRYVIKGDIYDIEEDRNVTEERLAIARSAVLAELSDEELIVFGNADSRYRVTVFTDVTCTYCRRMHSQIDDYVRRGIQIRYAAYPRNGLTSDSWRTMEDVWCAPDRQQALTLAKLDREFKTQACDGDYVTEQWQLGRMLGVGGTPAIFTESGQMIPGYLPPDQLLKKLQSMQSAE